MRKIQKALSNKSGASFPLIVAIALALLLIFCGVSEYFRLMIIAQGVRNAMQSAVISTVNDNYDDVYHGIREGYSGAYQPIADEFEESLDYGDIYDRIDSILGLTDSGHCHKKSTAKGELEFRIWDLSVDIRNAPFATGDQKSSRFEADSTIMLEVPVSFAGKTLPSMQIKVKSTAGYIPKF